MPPVTAILGGSIGSDPRSPRTWSGAAHFLFPAMTSAGLLHQAVGINLPSWQKALLMAKNYTPNRGAWRKRFYLDPAYRNALTKTAGNVPVPTPLAFQVGHWFCLPDVFPSKPCISYHDGNLPETLKAGFGLEGVPARRIDQALRYEESTANKMAAVFTFSEYLRQSFIHDYHVPAAKVFNVGGAVNLSAFPAAQPDKSYSAPRLLFIGVDFARKGGPQLVASFAAVRAAIPAAELHIVGPRELPPELNPLPAGIVFHGHLSKTNPADAAKLEALFLSSTLFVLPSLYEPFGIAPIEAMLYQIPAVVTNAWALRETVQPGLTGELVEKGSVEDLAAKIIHLLSDPARLAHMGRQARAAALDRYTWPKVVERMSAAITHLEPRPS
jgi:glycosyltransferase involved in cell wall biosynthesis